MAEQTHLAPDLLTVRGRGLSPHPSGVDEEPLSNRPTSGISSSGEDDDSGVYPAGEEFTMLDGVKRMNAILVKQIETMRLKIREDGSEFEASKTYLKKSKKEEVLKKEEEIDELRDKVTSQDDRIRQLKRQNDENDRLISSKNAEIDELKKLVRQTKEYSRKINRQADKIRIEKKRLESDPIYKQQNDEIDSLNNELELLKEKLATVDLELDRAKKVIEQQTIKMKALDKEKIDSQEKLKEEFEKTSKAMSQEVERMKEVMSQNCEEMKNIRKQNHEMSNDVQVIKAMLSSNTNVPTQLTSKPISVNARKPSKPNAYKPPIIISKQLPVKKNQLTTERTSFYRDSEVFSSQADTPDVSSRTIQPAINLRSHVQYSNLSKPRSIEAFLPPLLFKEVKLDPKIEAKKPFYGLNDKSRASAPIKR